MTHEPSFVGRPVSDVDTAALWVDLAALESNMATMAAVCDQHHVCWRPHVKSFK